MAILAAAAALVLAQSATAADVAYEDLAADRNEAAIERIEGNGEVDRSDPARLINLGVAYAREGRDDAARQLFVAALDERIAARLETASGAWIDSRDLARRALAMLDRGEFDTRRRVTMR